MQTLLICTLSFAIVSLVQGLVVCPSPAESYSPCSCDEYSQQPGTISLYCAFKNLNDSAVSDILDSFVNASSKSQSTISPIAELRLESNLLTRVPDQIRLFQQLHSVQLYGNEIEQIPPAAFNITVSPVRIVLYLNRIKTIAPYAFQSAVNGYGNGSGVLLNSNELKRFESAVFKPMLEKMIAHEEFPNSYLSINNNLFDCESDPCHLAWLVRDNRNLLSAVEQGKCSNGTTFDQLDANKFTNCPRFVCPLDYDGQYADPDQCSMYYLCVSGDAYTQRCPANTVFNPEIGWCDSISNVPSCQLLSTST